ncbi:uncharacterized protein LOC142144191 isoform X5 [Mixophyes fleayi]|uniref:uncharacterized protein LOC142144191 isoform X5 n=1 Tax=Mixophyes fleayi TaxID=3061075 RepID=UPI003F4D9F81
MHLKEHICLFYNLSFKTGIAVTIQTIVMTEEEQTSGGTEWLYQNCRLTTTMSYQHLQSICDFYYLFNKASHWHHEVLDRLSFRDVLDQMPMKESDTSNMVYVSLLWRRHCRAVLSQMPPQIPEEWMELAKLSFLFSENIKKQGIQLSSRTTDWVLKEQETLCTIEDQLLRTEAILKEAESAQREEQEFEDLLQDGQKPAEDHDENMCQENAPISLGSYVEYKHNDTGENKTCKRYKNLDSPASDYCGNNDIPDSRIKKQKYSINLFRELEEMYAIEECIFEENKKIEEFREVVQSAAVEEQANLFNQCKDKLLFWTLLDRERNHVDNLEKSLAREEATKQKHLRKKIDMAKIKKYCQDVIKENIKLLSEYHCQHCKDAKSESPKNTLTKEVGSLSLNNHTQLLPAQNHAVMGEAGTVVMPEKDSVTLE